VTRNRPLLQADEAAAAAAVRLDGSQLNGRAIKVKSLAAAARNSSNVRQPPHATYRHNRTASGIAPS
jgi:hypothetical protein